MSLIHRRIHGSLFGTEQGHFELLIHARDPLLTGGQFPPQGLKGIPQGNQRVRVGSLGAAGHGEMVLGSRQDNQEGVVQGLQLVFPSVALGDGITQGTQALQVLPVFGHDPIIKD
ncbi:hypothetical protein ES703_117600 [subsurface metagenome]